MDVRYNFIYKKLVTADDDLVGLIAYGISLICSSC